MAEWWNSWNADLDPDDGMRLPAAALDLFAEVEAEFQRHAGATPGWEDPHEVDGYEWGPDGSVPEEEYSRVTDVGKYDIVRVRVESWVTVLERRGARRLDPTAVPWFDEDAFMTSADEWIVLTGVREGSLPLIIGVSRAGKRSDGEEFIGSIVIGAGSPALSFGRIPDCGCDACDTGSDPLLEEVDRAVFPVVDGSLEMKAGRGRKGELASALRTWSGSEGSNVTSVATLNLVHRGAPWFDDWTSMLLDDWLIDEEGPFPRL